MSSDLSVESSRVDLVEAKKLEPAETRVKDVTSARKIYQILWEDDRPRRLKRGRIRNQIEGGKPWDPATLKRIGRSDATNHNFRGAEAAAERAESPFWEMAHNVPNKASFQVQEDYPDKERDEMSLAESFDLFLEDWGPDYLIKFKKLSQEYNRFGPGLVLWETSNSARFKPLKNNDVHVPKNTPMELSDWEVVFIDSDVPVSFLWDKIKEGELEGAKGRGWNPDMVKVVLTKVGDGVLGGGVDGRDLDDWDYIQDQIKNNDITVSNTWPSIRLVHMFVKEQNGNISHRIFIRDGLTSLARNKEGTIDASTNQNNLEGLNGDKKKETDRPLDEKIFLEDFIFEDLKSAENFNEKIGALYAEVGNGDFHGINGFGQKNYNHSVLINRIMCRLVDSLNWSTSMNFQRTAESSDDTPPVESFGSVNVFAPGISQLQYQPKLGESINVLSLLENGMSQNNALFRQESKQIGETKTATAASLLGQLQSQVEQATSAIFLVQLGAIYAECFRRLRQKGNTDPDAKKFVERCRSRKIPDKVIFKSDVIVGSGATAATSSPIARALLWDEMRTAARQTPGADVRYVDRMFFANKVGANAVKKIMPSDPSQTNAAIITDARIENTILSGAVELLADIMDDHLVHLDEHIIPLEGIAQSAITGIPVKPGALIAAQFISVHVEAHLEFLSQDTVRKEEFKELSKRYNIIKQVLSQIINQAASNLASETKAAANETAINQ